MMTLLVSAPRQEGLVVELIRLVPDVIWAALIAAGVAFFTTKLTNNYNARERSRDRAMALRRDVYLPAIEAVARAHGALSQTSNLELDITATGKQLQADLATLAKVQLVASEDTVRGLMQFQKALMPVYMELMALRIPLLQKRAEAGYEQTFIDRTLAEQEKFNQMLQELNLAGSTDNAARQRINLQFEAATRTFNEHAAKQMTLRREVAAGQLDLTEKLTELMPTVTQHVPDTLLAARRELELPIDEAAYRRQYREMQSDAEEMLKAFIARMRGLGKPPAAGTGGDGP